MIRKLDLKKTHDILTRIMEYELAGVVRYTHYSLMVSGPNRLPIVQFMKTQAQESLLHAQQAGEILTGLGGHPTLRIAEITETHQHSVEDIIRESVTHESESLQLYAELLRAVRNSSVYLEEFARAQIGQEELHSMELRKMLRDIGLIHPTETFPIGLVNLLSDPPPPPLPPPPRLPGSAKKKPRKTK